MWRFCLSLGASQHLRAAVGGELQAGAAGLCHEGHPRPPAPHRREEEGARARDHPDRGQVCAFRLQRSVFDHYTIRVSDVLVVSVLYVLKHFSYRL